MRKVNTVYYKRFLPNYYPTSIKFNNINAFPILFCIDVKLYKLKVATFNKNLPREMGVKEFSSQTEVGFDSIGFCKVWWELWLSTWDLMYRSRKKDVNFEPYEVSF